MSASMAEGMGAFLAQHPITWKRRDDPENDRVYFNAECGLCGVLGVHSPDRHRAEVMAANGYGKLGDAWEVGFTNACTQWITQRDDPSHPITRTNPYRSSE